jgi:uncharacterized membrane protein (DUF4010 family)
MKLLPAAVVVAIGALAVASYARTADSHVGATTEATAILAPLLGVLVALGHALAALSAAVLVTLLLTFKAPLHRIAGAVSEGEIVAILKFGIVAVVLVPLLPAAAVGPYDALVPRDVGVVVVILCAVSLAGYLLVRLLGHRAGWPLAGAAGGLVSSTAVTLSLSGKARDAPGLARPLALGILAASTVLYLRGLFLIAIFDRPLATHLAPRLLLLLAAGALAFAILWRAAARGPEGEVALGNPVELGRALALALVFAATLLVTRAAQAQFGHAGLSAAAVLGGLLDVDSVAIAAARLRQQGHASIEAAAEAYLLATLANLVVKVGIARFVGRRALGRLLLLPFAILALASALLILV